MAGQNCSAAALGTVYCIKQSNRQCTSLLIWCQRCTYHLTRLMKGNSLPLWFLCIEALQWDSVEIMHTDDTWESKNIWYLQHTALLLKLYSYLYISVQKCSKPLVLQIHLLVSMNAHAYGHSSSLALWSFSNKTGTNTDIWQWLRQLSLFVQGRGSISRWKSTANTKVLGTNW